MLLNFFIKNFRSIKDEQIFSMEASTSTAKGENTFDAELITGKTVKLLRIAAIYGANASGKSNLLHAFFALRKFIVSSVEIEDKLKNYNPFLFHENTQKAPTEFKINFLVAKTQYEYFLSFDENEIVKETLHYYPKGRANRIFSRSFENKKLEDNNLHIAKMGKDFGDKTMEVHKQQPLFYLFSKAEYYKKEVSDALNFFKMIDIVNLTASFGILALSQRAKMNISNDDSRKTEISKLLEVAGTGISNLLVENEDLMAGHKFYAADNSEKGHLSLSFNEESTGTRTLLAIGDKIINHLRKGGLILIDEIDTSFHPHLSRALVNLFRADEFNPYNAQIIFTTHEANLIDRESMRADQIWFTEKNEKGETTLFSAQDFEGIREDIPFDKWYLAGKFGALPNLADFSEIFVPKQKML